MATATITRREIRPASCITQEDGHVRLRLELPGVQKDGLDIQVDNEQLTIIGRRSFDDENRSYLLQERRRGDFVQHYTMDETIDREKIEADLHDGVLTLKLHLKEAVKPRKIEVKSK